MPDHVHLLLTLHGSLPGSDRTTPNLSNIIGWYKSTVTRKVGTAGKTWQKSYYDHIIRNETDYNDAWDYIDYNPQKYINKNL